MSGVRSPVDGEASETESSEALGARAAERALLPTGDPEAPGIERETLLSELALARARRALQVADSHAPATRVAYEADWRAFRAWCDRLAPVDASLVALAASDDTLSTYIGALDRRSPSSVRRAIAAIRLAHERAGYPALLEERPATVAVLRGHARRHARTPRKRQSAATDERIRLMADTRDTTTLIGLRDRALLLVGVDTGLRRSELVAIDIEHLSRQASGIVIRIPTAKSDQAGEGANVALLARPGSPWCPVEALERWLAAGGARKTGAVFVGLRRSRHCHEPGEQRLSGRAVARVVKAAAEAAGLPGDWAGHSLRRGMITTALNQGKEVREYLDQRGRLAGPGAGHHHKVTATGRVQVMPKASVGVGVGTPLSRAHQSGSLTAATAIPSGLTRPSSQRSPSAM